MPIYEYECEKCHHAFELVQSINAAPSAECPECKGKARRLISKPAIMFKGSGFHVTDYSRSGTTGSAPEAKPQTQTDTTKPSDSKKETKADKAAPSKPDASSKSDSVKNSPS